MMLHHTAFQNSAVAALKRPAARKSFALGSRQTYRYVQKRKCHQILQMSGTNGSTFSLQDRNRNGLRPKQSLGQNFLKDNTMINRIVDTFEDCMSEFCPQAHVVEVGPGLGALTQKLMIKYPKMLAIEIDQRAVAKLAELYPNLNVRHADVLQTNWLKESQEAAHPLAIIGNLPYNIMSQILFSLFEAPPGSVSFALVMMQKEVAERIVAKTRTKSYGILSVVGQLYSKPKILFSVPNTVFYPKPDVTSAMVLFEFTPDECLDVRNTSLTAGLRTIVRMAFNQRRKVLRNSLRSLCVEKGLELPEAWASKRAEELTPQQFVILTKYIFQKDIESFVVREEGIPSSVWRSMPLQ